MTKHQLFTDIVATYEKHGWKMRQLLLTPETREEFANDTLDACPSELSTTHNEVGTTPNNLSTTADDVSTTRGSESVNDGKSSPVIKDSVVDAIWFSRPSHKNREAWELRLLAETSYALFETFEADEDEELREEARMEMEARLRGYVGRS